MKKFEYLVDKPVYVSYTNRKGVNNYEYISATQLGGSHEKEYIDKMQNNGWELCGAPISASLGNSYIYYWKRPIDEKKDVIGLAEAAFPISETTSENDREYLMGHRRSFEKGFTAALK